MSKKEDNPFSFKHFLKKDSLPNYQNAGARPKVYFDRTHNNHSNPTSLEESIGVETDGVYSRNPTELPDFVQDHLVIEQCYSNNQDVASSTQMIADIDNLPDFALNSVESRPLKHRIEKKQSNIEDLPSELPRNLDKRSRDGLSINNGSFESGSSGNFRRLNRNHQNSREFIEPVNFPLDLPYGRGSTETNNVGKNTWNDTTNSPDGSINDNGIPKSLPDFLSDGPIRNRVVSQVESNAPVAAESSDIELNYVNEILKRDLEIARRQINEKNRQIQILEAELASRRATDYEETINLEKAMEQVEDNLKRSTRRAVNAESAVTSLKQEIKMLNAEISALRVENRDLRNAVGINFSSSRSKEDDTKIHKIANDIRDAASSANSLLRQLILGVDNLKLLASTLDNIDRIEDRTKDFLIDSDQDNATGPAL
ncbi:uncharacterized protein l(3)04053 [Chelonus insularis]|uniref:uncharacterized protein l(3)04053 n=1 Tax=Chelonus insularis TaxID=460826 RepID=UPI00158BFD84|nr:uncharacterized protein LOC118072015 [Chelonus insularis]